MSIFRPHQILQDFMDFDYLKYKNDGYNTIFIDIDNTLALPDVELKASEKASKFINNLKGHGFTVYILSNNTKERVEPYAKSIKCDYYYFALKPLPFSYLKLIKKYKLDKSKIICMGDQLLTDCLGANLLGLCSIYVKQLVEKDIIKTKLNRFIERKIFKYILHEKV